MGPAASKLLAGGIAALVPPGGTGLHGYAVTQPPSGWVPLYPSWEAVSVSRGEREVSIQVTIPSCTGYRNLRVSSTEARRTLVVRVRAEQVQEPPTSPGGPPTPRSCPAPHTRPFTLHLARPLAGRRIIGQRPAGGMRWTSEMVAGRLVEGNVVPRLVGFSPTDAAAALREADMGMRRTAKRHHAGLPRVVAQRPGPGAFLALRGIVTLTVSGG